MKICIVFFLLLTGFTGQAQFVGINTNTPQAMLHVKDSNVLFTGPNPFVNYGPTSGPSVQGPGTRMLWYAQKGAFRAGWVENNRWDKDSIGPFSIGLGHSVLAYNTASFASGLRTSAWGIASTASGYNTEALGDYSFAAGYQSKALQQLTISMGSDNIASGYFSVAIGGNNIAANTSSTAIGQSNIASGVEAVAAGSNLKAKARSSFVAGWYNDTMDFPDPVLSAKTDRIFQIGNGDGFFGTRSNALTILRNGNHGLGTLIPTARLQVADSSVLFTGPATMPVASPAPPPVQGPGTRFLWYPQKAALRAGSVFTNQWDKDSVGDYSAAFGSSTMAKGESSFAMGSLSTATGTGSVAMGIRNKAEGTSSFALGIDAIASGDRSFAFGDQAIASGYGASAIGNYVNSTAFSAIAIGHSASAIGNYSHSIGNFSIAQGGSSMTLGERSRSTGNYAISAGYYTRARSDYSFVTGRYNDSSATNRIFEVGNGTAENNRKNAVTIIQNGYMGINTANPLATLHVADSSVVFTGIGGAAASPAPPPVSGNGRRMMWYSDRAAFRSGFVNGSQWDRENVGDYSLATGFDTRASALGGIAMGIGAISTATAGVAMGWNVTAGGNYSVSMGLGSSTSGNYCMAMGNTALAQANSAIALGDNVTAKAHSGFVSGRYNDISDAPNAGLPQATDRIFQLGNGSDNANRSNALTVLRNGNMGIGNLNPLRPISFPPVLGEKILLYPGGAGEVGIGVYGNELRIHCDNPGSKVSFGTQDNAGNFTEAARAQISGAFAFSVFGSLWVNGTTYASDERFKQNITPISSPLQKLMQLNGVEYEMNLSAFPKSHFQLGRQSGLIAQNVEKIMPDAVQEMNGYKGVDYAKLVPLLIESIKEQQRKIDMLEKQNEEIRQSLQTILNNKK